MSITQQVLICAEAAQAYAILADASALSALSGPTASPPSPSTATTSRMTSGTLTASSSSPRAAPKWSR